MDQEIQALQKELQEVREIIEKDHEMIQSVYRRVRLSSAISVIKWVVIIGFSLGAFYYIQPLLEVLLKTYTSIGGSGVGQSESSIDLLRSMIK